MFKNALCAAFVAVYLFLVGVASAKDADLVAWWSFDDRGGTRVPDAVSGVRDEIVGNFEYAGGVRGYALDFDGYTTTVVRKSAVAPRLTTAFTIEAWVAPQVYPWNLTAVVDQKDRFFFGLDAEGHLVMKLNLSGGAYRCASEEKLALLKWSHIAGTFDSDKGAALFINGKRAAELSTQGSLPGEGDCELWIGRSHQDLSPARTERKPSRKLRSPMVFDGLIDEVKIYSRALSADEVAECVNSSRPSNPQPLKYRRMPSGPKDLPKRFCAYYTRLRYDDEWERLWRVGDYPDILVTFDESPVRVVFWRGTSYGASWVTENGRWMGDQSLEDGTRWGCGEHMSDKHCRYSHVRLIENHDARIVVHWRYAVCDILYNINHPDPVTGWGDWADEYYYIYPDAVATRQQVLHSNKPGGFQWQETIFFNQPGTRPEDNVEMEAFTLADMQGRTHTYSWADGAPEDFPLPAGANIQVTNLKSKYRPFIIFPPGPQIKAFGDDGEFSNFPCWNHWPVAQLPNDGREVFAADRPSSSSLSNYKPRPEHLGGVSYAAVSLYGMTDKPIESLLPLARSWLSPAKLQINGGDFIGKGYDRYQRAYVIEYIGGGEPPALEFTLQAGPDSPVVNPAFVVKNWGRAAAVLTIDGKTTRPGPDLRLGRRRRLEGTDLIAWLKLESTKPVVIKLSPQTSR